MREDGLQQLRAELQVLLGSVSEPFYPPRRHGHLLQGREEQHRVWQLHVRQLRQRGLHHAEQGFGVEVQAADEGVDHRAEVFRGDHLPTALEA